MINVGLIGAGGIGRVHAEPYTNIQNAKLISISDKDKDRKKLAAEYGAAYHEDAQEMLSGEDIDILDI